MNPKQPTVLPNFKDIYVFLLHRQLIFPAMKHSVNDMEH